ncbi:MAG: hypothetical protein ACK5HA_05550 [Planctomycetaceae bacterium]
MLAVGEIEPEDIDPGEDQFGEPVLGFNGGPDRGDDLGFDTRGAFDGGCGINVEGAADRGTGK